MSSFPTPRFRANDPVYYVESRHRIINTIIVCVDVQRGAPDAQPHPVLYRLVAIHAATEDQLATTLSEAIMLADELGD